ncbi:hypothetical protein [Metapseudomonas otitidis]|uniref:hypothetical protein n=1 Tax=Metapseudomonas otitidis TaxID=319939 RepID=UPI001F32A62A|nr:hypothetical protein [Pseudomonas otitidis]
MTDLISDFLLEPLQLDRLLGDQIDASSQLELAAGGLLVHTSQFGFGCSLGSAGVWIDMSIGVRALLEPTGVSELGMTMAILGPALVSWA